MFILVPAHLGSLDKIQRAVKQLYVWVWVCMCVWFAAQMRSEIAYANSKGIEVGGYDLIVWTRGGVPEDYVAVGGQGTCIASSWYVVVSHTAAVLLIITTLTSEIGALHMCFDVNTAAWAT